ncbi:hypothetical protein [Jiangella alkaliphila]|uniref:Uncharacterized protein n=1 Tax=Jiangella alkaliphila TaxID=419479 RepID=A0A1H2GLA4_9ACTN|nr:hypothetical protein [Jiangella alkaliphila]SDU20437.1 hypothetical protein SAMN04488563_0564 [Jiangella alkaliphila]
MTPRSTNFRSWFAWFSDTSQEADSYIEGCERVPEWLAEGNQGFIEFRAELATHIKESSLPPRRNESQWGMDEWLRDIWFDAFGPEPAPGDPYPVPLDRWGRVRFTDYLLHAVGEDDEDSSPGAAAWLAARGLDAATVTATPDGEMENVRPEPADYADRLARLTEAGLREP